MYVHYYTCRSSSEEPNRKRSPASTASEQPLGGHRHHQFCAGSASPSEDLPTKTQSPQATPPSINHLSTSLGTGAGRAGHRNSVGSIDTETFGKRNCDGCSACTYIHHDDHHHHQDQHHHHDSHLLGHHPPLVVDSSYSAEPTYCVNHSSSCWLHGAESSSGNSSRSGSVPGLSCGSLDITDSRSSTTAIPVSHSS